VIRGCKIFITLRKNKRMVRKFFSASVTQGQIYAEGCVITLEDISKNVSD